MVGPISLLHPILWPDVKISLSEYEKWVWNFMVIWRHWCSGISAFSIGMLLSSSPYSVHLDNLKCLGLPTWFHVGTKFIMAWVVSYHTLAGLRHLVWDTKSMLKLDQVNVVLRSLYEWVYIRSCVLFCFIRIKVKHIIYPFLTAFFSDLYHWLHHGWQLICYGGYSHNALVLRLKRQ